MRKMTNDEFIKKARKIHGDKYDYSLVEYINNETKIKIGCPTHGIIEQTPNSHLRHNCFRCVADKLLSNKEEFIEKSKKIHGDKYDYSLVKYNGSYKKIKIICSVHEIFEQAPYSHLLGRGCIKCFAKNKCDSNDEFIKKAKETHGDKYDYSLINYENVTKKMKIICKKHDTMFLQSASYHLRGIGCPICNESKGEEKISKFLKNKKIKFEREKRFIDCRNILPLPFDFYLPNLNICIEFDGKQHFIQHKKWEDLINIKKRDEIKNIYCKENNIQLHRISYKDINLVEEKLKEIFK